MKSFLLDDLLTRLSMENVLTGILLAAFGLAVIFLAKKIARAIRKKDEVAPNDNIYLIFKALGLIMIVIALILMIAQ